MPAAGPERLLEKLGKGKPPAAVVLLGEDAYWRELCRRKLIETLVPEAVRGWAVARVSAEESGMAEVIGRAQTRPMLAGHQLIFVEEAGAWEQGGDEAVKENLKALTAYFEDPAPFTTLVLEAGKFDQRTRLSRLLNEHALVVELGAPGADPARLAVEMAREQSVEIEPEAAAALAAATGGSAARMAVEVEKLACYAGERRAISAADVRELVVAEGAAEVWELADLLASRRRGAALELIDDLLRKGETGPRLVGALAYMFRKLLEASELPASANGWQAAQRLGMRPKSAETALAHARRIPRLQLRLALVLLAEADDRLKSAAADDRAIMEFLVAGLSRLGEPAGSKAAR
jgi:DNA polymerase III subunit delta